MKNYRGAAVGGTARSNDGPSATPLSLGETQAASPRGAAFLLAGRPDAAADGE